jgi:hypothetical protein
MPARSRRRRHSGSAVMRASVGSCSVRMPRSSRWDVRSGCRRVRAVPRSGSATRGACGPAAIDPRRGPTPPSPPLGTRRGHQPREPGAALPPPSLVGARRRLAAGPGRASAGAGDSALAHLQVVDSCSRWGRGRVGGGEGESRKAERPKQRRPRAPTCRMRGRVATTFRGSSAPAQGEKANDALAEAAGRTDGLAKAASPFDWGRAHRAACDGRLRLPCRAIPAP